MTEQTTEAPRLRTPGWKDPRLIVGVILVVLSVTGVVALIQSADARQGYWAAATDVVPGAPHDAAAFHIVQVNLADVAQHYWPADEPLPAEFYVAATLLQGELLTRRDVTEADPAGRQQVGVQVLEHMPASIRPGSRVDVWVSAPSEDGRGFDTPVRLVANAEVVGKAESSSAFAAADTTTVYLMLSQSVVPAVLDAQANVAKISLVPATAGE